jgi:hypothetical protein
MSLEAFKGLFAAKAEKYIAKQTAVVAKTEAKLAEYNTLYPEVLKAAVDLGVTETFQKLFPEGGGKPRWGSQMTELDSLHLYGEDILPIKALNKVADSPTRLERDKAYLDKMNKWASDGPDAFFAMAKDSVASSVWAMGKSPKLWDKLMGYDDLGEISSRLTYGGTQLSELTFRQVVGSSELIAALREIENPLTQPPYSDEAEPGADPAGASGPLNETDESDASEGDSAPINEGDGEPSEASDGGAPINLEDGTDVEKEEEVSKVESTEPAVEAEVAAIESPATPESTPSTPINDDTSTPTSVEVPEGETISKSEYNTTQSETNVTNVTNTENTITSAEGEVLNTPTVIKEGDTYNQGSINEQKVTDGDVTGAISQAVEKETSSNPAINPQTDLGKAVSGAKLTKESKEALASEKKESKVSGDKSEDTTNIDNSVINDVTSTSSSSSSGTIDLFNPVAGEDLAVLNSYLGIDPLATADSPDDKLTDESINTVDSTEPSNVSASAESVVNESAPSLKSKVEDKAKGFLEKTKNKVSEKIDVAKDKIGLDKDIAPINEPTPAPKDDVTLTEVEPDKPDSKRSIKKEERKERKEERKEEKEAKKESRGMSSAGTDMSGVESRLRKIENLLSGPLEVKIID